MLHFDNSDEIQSPIFRPPSHFPCGTDLNRQGATGAPALAIARIAFPRLSRKLRGALVIAAR